MAKAIFLIGLTLVVGIGIISVTQSAAMQKGSNNNLLAAWGAEKKTIFLHQKPEANLTYNKTIHGYASSDGKIFKCNTFFDGVIYYKANDTNYFKCVDRGSTHGKNAEFQVVPG